MLKNLEDAKANNRHKKNKSESFSKQNRRDFSIFNVGLPGHAKQKRSKNLREEDFFEFNDSHRNEELNISASTKQEHPPVASYHQKYMSQDYRLKY